MGETLSTADVREQNSLRLLRYVYGSEGVSKQQIAQELKMSLPTVSQNLKLWEEQGMILRTGMYHSTGGRKARVYQFAAAKKVAVGIAVQKEYFHVVVVDLYGKPLRSFDEQRMFSCTDDYFERIAEVTESQLLQLHPEKGQVLGVSIAIQGLVSRDGGSLLFGRILECSGERLLEKFERCIPYPCSMMHDTEASALAESWIQKDMKDAVLLYLNRYFGGAVIVNGKVYQGIELSSSVIEHMCLYPGGEKCYCGKKGCIEAYCSAYALQRNAGEKLRDFFIKLRAGDKKAAAVWNRYLHDLALTISNIRMLMDTEYVLCGYLLRYMLPSDVELLERMVQAECPFDCEKVRIRTSLYTDDSAAIGAGIYLTRRYMSGICNGEI